MDGRFEMAVSLRDVLCFGRYEPLFRVAAGGMAEVYAARIQGEAGFQKLVAVKRMLPHLASEPGFIDMFLNEARLAAYVASPHVVQTLDLGRGSDGSLYIVMELVVGLSLAKILEGHPGPLPLPIAVELMAQAAQGLDDAHEATTPAGDALGLIHRDVSPHNILLGVDGRVRVTDFGIARAVHRPRAETNARELKGKFAYMSPEQTRLKDVDRRSDVFSIGIVLWELLAGQRLFMDRDPIEAVRLVQKKRVVPPFELRPEVPEPISNVVLRALERDRDARFQSAGELALALRRAARESWGEPPQKRDIAAFVESSGGDELHRLQRLIRLGTEGAGADAIEALQPGVTRILTDHASGVAPAGTIARRTSVLERGEAEEHAMPTVMLSADEMTPEAVTIAVATPDDELEEDITAENTRPGITPARPGTAPVAVPCEPEPTGGSRRTPTDAFVSAPVAASSVEASTVSIAKWAIGLGAFATLSFGLGLAAVLLWPESSSTVSLPPVPEGGDVTTVAGPPSSGATALEAVVFEPQLDSDAPSPGPVVVHDVVEDADEPEDTAAAVEPAPEPKSATKRRRRQPRAERRSARRLPSNVGARQAREREPARGTGTLLGVQAFDRSQR